MNSNTRDRIKVFIIGGILLLCLAAILYAAFGNPKTSTMMYTREVKIIYKDDTEAIRKCEQYKTVYAHKETEGDKFLLKYTDYEYPEKHIENTIILTKKQYDEIQEGNYYYFKIKIPRDESKEWILKKIYDESPVQK